MTAAQKKAFVARMAKARKKANPSRKAKSTRKTATRKKSATKKTAKKNPAVKRLTGSTGWMKASAVRVVKKRGQAPVLQIRK